MIRLFVLAFAIAGLSLMAVQPSSATYGDRRAEMLPPTGYIGNYSYVSCWYHTGGCPPYGSYGPNAIDWLSYPTDSGDYRVWQRFHVWPQDPNYYVITYLTSNYEDSDGCDYYRLYVYDGTNWAYQGRVTYYHANNTWPGAYTQEYPGRIANWLDGSMTNDNNCSLGWTGYHVHERSLGDEWLNPVFNYYGPLCVGAWSRVCTNNSLSNVTRAFIW